MKDDTKYYDYLVANAKNGNTNSYLELCSYFYKSVFQIVYYLHPDKKHASQITVRVFEKGWEHIKRKKNDIPILFWFTKLSLIVSYYHLKAEAERSKNTNQFQLHFTTIADQSSLSDLEDKFLQLSIEQKISLTLFVKLQLSPAEMAKAFSEKNEKETKEDLAGMMFYLKSYSVSETIRSYDKDTIDKLVEADTANLLFQSDIDTKIIEGYRYLKEELNNLFKSIDVNPKILTQLKSALHYNQEAKLHQFTEVNEVVPDGIEIKFDAYAEKIIEKTLDQKDLLIDVKEKKSNFRLILIIVLILTSTLYGLLHFGVIDLGKKNTPWSVEPITGTYLLNSSKSSKVIEEGQTLILNNNSLADIFIPTYGKIRLTGQSELVLLNGDLYNNSVNLKNGNFYFTHLAQKNNLEEDKSFSVKTRFGEISSDAESNFEIDLVNNIVKVDYGLLVLKFKSTDDIFYVGSGYQFSLDNLTTFPSCYYSKTTKIPINSEQNYLIRNIDPILESATEVDMLTLWHLIKVVNSNDRQKVINKLKEYLPIIDDSLAQKLNQLEEESLFLLLNTIENELNYIDYTDTNF